MTERKPLYMGDEGYPVEVPTTDSMTLGGLTMGGNIIMQTNKITGLGAGSSAGDALSYGQSSASLAGLSLTNVLNMNNNQINSVGAPSLSGDVTNKAYVDNKVITGGSIKEAVLDEGDQLSDSQGIRAGGILFFAAQPVAGDTVVFKNGSLTRTYTFVADQLGEVSATDVSIETDAATAMARLAVRAMADAGNTQWQVNWQATAHASINSGGTIEVFELATAAGASASRIYGTWGTPASAQVVEYASGTTPTVETDYTKITSVNLPGSDPGYGRFGFRRQVSALSPAELHLSLGSDSIWSWDDDANVWQQFSGSGSIPDSTSASGGGTKGKIGVDSDNAVYVASGILKLGLNTTGGLQFNGTDKKLEIKNKANSGLASDANGEYVVIESNKGLGVTSAGLKTVPDIARGLNVDSSGLYLALATDPGLEFATNLLQAKIYSAGGLQKNSDGLSAKLNGTTLQVSSSGLSVKGLPSTFEVAAVATTANVSAANLNTLTGGIASNADSLHTHTAISPDEAKKVENDIAVSESVSAGNPVSWSAVDNQVLNGRADTAAKARIIGVARTAQATPGQVAPIVSHGLCAGILTSATVNTPYYLQATGGIGTGLPAGGNRVILIGYAQNATDLWVNIIDFGKKAS
jgi:hypothetical protein